MKNGQRFYPRNFENAIFNILSSNRSVNNIYFNHLLEKLYEKYQPIKALNNGKIDKIGYVYVSGLR